MDAQCFLMVLICLAGIHGVFTKDATLTLLKEEAQKMNAVCLDGSPPGYYMRAGSGAGANKWILYFMGGGWCEGSEDCYKRSMTKLGSTTNYTQTTTLEGLLSDNSTVNPDFYNWNIVYVIYCDGASFAGNKEEPDIVNGKKLYYRGYRILQAIIANLKQEKGMDMATDVILTGCSAGGLAVYLHADFVKTLLPPTAKYRAMPDAGYFVDIDNIDGKQLYISHAESVMKQDVTEALMPACKAKYNTSSDSWKCFFTPYIFDFITTPIFVLNSMYDTAQLGGFGLPCLPPNCSAEMMKKFELFHEEFMQKVQPVLAGSDGFYLDSCLIHCHSKVDRSWGMLSAQGHPMRESFADWYYERPSSVNATRVKDCDYPCNHSCKGESVESVEYDGFAFN